MHTNNVIHHCNLNEAAPLQGRTTARGNMIIELFGPPASGKSTLANALVAALHRAGIKVQLKASSRPAEPANNYDCQTFNTRRWSRVTAAPFRRAAKMIGLANVLISGEIKTEVGEKLLELLPPKDWFGRMRLQRYLWLLHRSHSSGNSFQGVTIVDQGYVTALCSLAARTNSLRFAKLVRGLDLVPQPDLLICLNTPDEVLEERWLKRLNAQTIFEQMFEQNFESSRRQGDMVRAVGSLLKENSWPIINVEWVDGTGLAKSVETLVSRIAMQREVS